MIGRSRHFLVRLRDQARGVTLVEFGLISPALILTIMALSDMGYQSYMRSVMRGVLEKAARATSIGTLDSDQVDAYIRQQIVPVLPKNANTPEIIKTSYRDFSNVGKPEKITADIAPLGVYNKGDCYQDANRNGMYDQSGGSTKLDGGEDIVYYEVKVTMPRIFPMAKLLGWSADQTVTANTLIRNQPWEWQGGDPPVICS